MAKDGTWMDYVKSETTQAAEGAQQAFPKDVSLASIFAMIATDAMTLTQCSLMDAA